MVKKIISKISRLFMKVNLL